MVLCLSLLSPVCAPWLVVIEDILGFSRTVFCSKELPFCAPLYADISGWYQVSSSSVSIWVLPRLVQEGARKTARERETGASPHSAAAWAKTVFLCNQHDSSPQVLITPPLSLPHQISGVETAFSVSHHAL